MKKLYLLLFIGIIVLPKFSYSQKRTVTQTTNIRTLFSIPLDTNLEKLTDPDLARMEIKDKLESKEVIISKKDLAMEIIITDLTEYENLSDYKFGIRTTVLNTHGIELYDYEDSLVSFVVHEEPGAASFYTLPEKMYPDYGFFNNLFEFNTEKAAENLLSENYTVEYSPKNKILKAYNDSVQLSIDFQNLYYETLFFRDNELKYIDYKYYIKDGDHIVPFKESYSSFEYTINGIRMLRTNETTYIEYSVTEGDSVLYERSEKQQNNNKGINFHQ
ncbi:MAG: hypothetical protein LBQ22_08635, partial [Bacteroidales bacterium]|nr:hypothetical protein [Bacteroidales bacterium]